MPSTACADGITNGVVLQPEATVSALVFHHPDAAYFSAGVEDEDAVPRA